MKRTNVWFLFSFSFPFLYIGSFLPNISVFLSFYCSSCFICIQFDANKTGALEADQLGAFMQEMAHHDGHGACLFFYLGVILFFFSFHLLRNLY
mgnify:CR=1 FL=1